MSLFNTAHLTVCGCPSCTGQSAPNQGETPNSNLFNAKTVNAEQLAVSGSVEGYARAVTGNDAKLWVAGAAGTETFGQGITLKYTYANGVSWANNAGNSGGTVYTAVRQAAMNDSMQMFSDVSGVKFELGTATNANIAFKSYNLSGAAGVAYVSAYSTGKIAQVETVLANAPSAYGASSDAQAFAKGGYGYLCAIHELGHTLGLKHTGNYNAGGGGAAGPYLSDSGIADNNDASVMSYSAGVVADAAHRPTGLMFVDLVAIQTLYGANTAYNSGTTDYVLTTSSGVKAIWDGGGAGDTLNASAQTAAVTLDLREGINNWTRVGEARLQMAKGANIENATGGSGNDTITGNAAANVLTGNGGVDTLIGGAGNDSLIGGAGADIYQFDANGGGTDVITDTDGSIVMDGVTLAGTATASGAGYVLSVSGVTYNLSLAGSVLSISRLGGSSVVQVNNFASGNLGINLSGTPSGGGGGAGATVVNGTAGIDTLLGTVATEIFNLLDSNDKFDNSKVKGAADIVFGGTGNDTITSANSGSYYGEAGNDVLVAKTILGATILLDGGEGDDKLTGGDGANTLNGGAGNDIIAIGKGTTTVNGGTGNDSVKGGALNDSISGGDGSDTVTGGAGDDVITGDAGNDNLSGGDGDDRLFGDIGNDIILAGGGLDKLSGGVGNDTIVLSDDNVMDTVAFSSIALKDGSDTITGFERGVDKITFMGTAGTAYDDITGGKGIFNFASGNAVNFATVNEGWVVTANAGNLTDLTAIATLLNTGNTITAAKGSDGLIVLNIGGTTGLYHYLENGTVANNISAAELTLLGTVAQDGALSSADFIFATL